MHKSRQTILGSIRRLTGESIWLCERENSETTSECESLVSYYLELLARKGVTLSDDAADIRRAGRLPVETDAPKQEKRPYYGGGHPVVAISEDGRRICSRCKRAKSRDEYSKNKNKADGLDARCKACRHEIYLERRNNNPEDGLRRSRLET